MTYLIYITFLAFIFRFFRELEDETVRKPERNWAFKPNSEQGWTAKWQYPLQEYQPRWYHFGLKPKHKERFPFSSTLLVPFTDAEHFYQFVQTISLLISVALVGMGGYGITILGYYIASWIVSLGAFSLGLMVAQVVKEKIKTIN